MKKFSERGQGALVFVGLAALVAVLLMLMMAGNQRNMQEGAEAIGDAVGDAIDSATTQQIDTMGEAGAETIESYVYDQTFEQRYLDLESGLVMTAWVSKQKLYPNKYAASKRPIDSNAATNCYNNFGTFETWEVLGDDKMNWDLHMLCRDTNKTIYDIILRRRGTSKEYDFINAFIPKKETGNLYQHIIQWLKGKMNAHSITPPSDITIYIDGVIP